LYLGGADGFLYTLIAFVVVDYLTGILRVIVENTLSSRVGAKGIMKKVAIFLIVGTGIWLTVICSATWEHQSARRSSPSISPTRV
jgi:phage-related holin